jgi:hypothetical protein
MASEINTRTREWQRDVSSTSGKELKSAHELKIIPTGLEADAREA